MKMSDERWYFTKEQLENSPSRKAGIDTDKELSQRQQAANFIQDMGQRLAVTQLCINTAIVYMHRFYVFHSFTHFHRNAIATAALFLAAKVEEQPRKLEFIIKISQLCLQKNQPNADRRSEVYLAQAQELVMNENILLQTLGFDVAIGHPHTYIVNFCHLINASKDLSQTSYFMASNSLHLTTMCLQYKPSVVACFCIHLVSKWSDWHIPNSKENHPWYHYIDPTVTQELLEQLTSEFLVIFDKCPSRLKKKIQMQNLGNQNSLSTHSIDAVDSRKSCTNNKKEAVVSHSADIISSVVKEVAKQHEKQYNNNLMITVKTEPEDNEKHSSSSANRSSSSTESNVAIIKPGKSHSIFSPSPIEQRDSIKISPVNNTFGSLSVDKVIKTEPVTPDRKLKNTGGGGGNSLNLEVNSELIPICKKVETVAGYENIFRKNVVPMTASISTTSSSVKYENIPKENNNKKNNNIAASGSIVAAVNLPVPVNNIKDEPCNISYDCNVKSVSSTSQNELFVNHEKFESNVASTAVGGSSSSHSHKKKKKHKEKDKRHDKEKHHHKEKKRHKEDKHHHRKEHHREKDHHNKEPGPIKITIPKEKLNDIPVKLKIKLNKDQVVAPAAPVDESNNHSGNDFKLKISKEKIKSRKRDRESDHDHSSSKKLILQAN